MSDKPKVPPLRARTMTLDELQRETLEMVKKVRAQFSRPHWQSGTTDNEFIDQVLVPLATSIMQDRTVLRMKRGGEACPHAYPHTYCNGCKVSPCPIGLDGTVKIPEEPNNE